MTQYIIRDHARKRDCYWSGTQWGTLSAAMVVAEEGAHLIAIGDLGEDVEYEALPRSSGSDMFDVIAAAGAIVGRQQPHADVGQLGRLVRVEAEATLVLDTAEDFNPEQIADSADMTYRNEIRIDDISRTLMTTFGLAVREDTRISTLITAERPASMILNALESDMMVDTGGLDLTTMEDIGELADRMDGLPSIQPDPCPDGEWRTIWTDLPGIRTEPNPDGDAKGKEAVDVS